MSSQNQQISKCRASGSLNFQPHGELRRHNTSVGILIILRAPSAKTIFGDVVGAFTIDLTLFVSHSRNGVNDFGVLKTLLAVVDRSIGSINKFYVAQIRRPRTQSEIYSNSAI